MFLHRYVRVGLPTILAVAAVLAGILFLKTASAANSNSVALSSAASQYLSIPAASQTGLNITGDITIEAWIKFKATGVDQFIVSRDNHDTVRGYDFLVDTNNKLVLEYFGPGNTHAAFRSVDAVNAPIGVWTHLAASVNVGGQTAIFYRNGVPIVTNRDDDNTTSIQDVSVPLTIGAAEVPGNVVSFLDGKIDDVRIWSVARTGAQIDADMNQELVGNEPNLVAYWKLNGDLTDSTANGNALINNNGATFSTDVPFAFVPPVTAVRKSTDETVTSSATLQDDDQLAVQVQAGTTYIVDGVVLVSAANATPDIKIAFTEPAGSDMTIGYTSTAGAGIEGVLQTSGASSVRIPIPAPSTTLRPVLIHGTVVAGSSGTLQLQWTQFAANAGATKVSKGSYLQVSAM